MMTCHSKKCKVCNIAKDISEFYKNKGMSDGYLNKCKACCIEYTLHKEKIKKSTPEGLERERKRQRNKYYNRGNNKPDNESRLKNSKAYKQKYPEKYKAKNACYNLVRLPGEHLHHWNYNELFWRDIISIGYKKHAKIHRFLIYNPKLKIYMTKQGLLLDTKQKHLDYLNKILKEDDK